MVLRAQDAASPHAAEALAELCRAYWYPLYAFARRRGFDEHLAKDLTQGFFARLLEKNYISHAQPEKGRFRSFLLAAFKHFISDQHDHQHAVKRGGGLIFESFEGNQGEERYLHEPADSMDPEKLYERRWALTLLEKARTQLRKEFADAGKEVLYERMQDFEEGDPPPYADVAPKVGLSEEGLRSAVFRMRRRYRELICDEVAQTVEDPSEIAEELRYLIRVISH